VLILTIANMKKGTGKTLTTQRLADALVGRGKRVLLLDLDPEMDRNLTRALGTGRFGEFPSHTLYEALEEQRTITPFAVGPALGLIPAHSTLQQAETWRSLDLNRLTALDDFFRHAHIEIYGQRHFLHLMYDVAILDCPAGISALFFHAISAADHILIPEWVPPGIRRDPWGPIMTMDTAIRQRYKNARPTADVCTTLSIPFDARLGRPPDHLLAPEVAAQIADDQDAFWQHLAICVTR
jgi:hypothetical protein